LNASGAKEEAFLADSSWQRRSRGVAGARASSGLGAFRCCAAVASVGVDASVASVAVVSSKTRSSVTLLIGLSPLFGIAVNAPDGTADSINKSNVTALATMTWNVTPSNALGHLLLLFQRRERESGSFGFQ
jgi:hypothetical protein